jgi:hypothetical protein
MYQHKHRTACFVAETMGKPCAISEVMPEVLARYGLPMDVPELHDIRVSLVPTGNLLDFSGDKIDCLANCS